MDLPERYWIPLLTVKAHGEQIVTSIKLQKLVFLLQAEGHIRERYRFVKHHYGPYSEELSVDTQILRDMALLDIDTKLALGGYPYNIYKLTQHGNQALEALDRELDSEEKARVNEIVSRYKSYRHDVLLKYVYTKYVMDPDQIAQMTTSTRDNVWSLREKWNKLYSPDCLASTVYLAILDYVALGLGNLEKVKDPVVRSVWLSTALELTSRLISVTAACAPAGDCSHASPSNEIFELINYLDDYSRNNGIASSLSELDLSNLISREEAERLQEMIKQGV